MLLSVCNALVIKPVLTMTLGFMNPEAIIQVGGLALLICIIFAETGLFFGFFLPGDSLLFVAGLLSGTKYLDVPLVILIPVLTVAAVAGSILGYFTGKWARNFFAKGKESFFYKRKYLDMTEDFFNRFGMMAFVLGRFLPIIRTFVTILAGLARIPFYLFMMYNAAGAAIWVSVMILSGYWLGIRFPGIGEYIEIIVIGMVIVSTIPAFRLWRKHFSVAK